LALERSRLTIASTLRPAVAGIGQHRPSGVREDRNVDTARTIEGGIGHDLSQEAPGASADAMLKAGRSQLACRKEFELSKRQCGFGGAAANWFSGMSANARRPAGPA
jgi:hypothetical protein